MAKKIAKISIAFLAVILLLCGTLISVSVMNNTQANVASIQVTETVAQTQAMSTETTTFDYGTDVVTQTIAITETPNGVECEFKIQSRARGLLCTIAVSVQGDREGTVTGIAKNTFTLGKSIIPVYIVLWSADSKTGIDLDIDPEGFNYTKDLNIFKSIDCSNGTGGRAKYWQAHAYWNFDNKGWEHGLTPVAYYDANAVYDKNK